MEPTTWEIGGLGTWKPGSLGGWGAWEPGILGIWGLGAWDPEVLGRQDVETSLRWKTPPWGLARVIINKPNYQVNW